MKSPSILEKFNVKPLENASCVYYCLSTNAKCAFKLKYVQPQVQLSLVGSACDLKS